MKMSNYKHPRDQARRKPANNSNNKPGPTAPCGAIFATNNNSNINNTSNINNSNIAAAAHSLYLLLLFLQLVLLLLLLSSPLLYSLSIPPSISSLFIKF